MKLPNISWHSRRLFEFARVEAIRLLLLNDAKRWSDSSELCHQWDERTKAIGGLIRANSRVVEFGAGRGSLVNYLPEGCTYCATDFVLRKGMKLFDLNSREYPEIGSFDFAVFSGVLEYVKEIEEVAGYLSSRTPEIIASYSPTDTVPGKVNRRLCGWINDLSRRQFIATFEAPGYSLVKELQWNEQTIFHFAQ